MDFEIYCDESGLEALSDKEAHLFSGIGGIWFPAKYRPAFKQEMKRIKNKYGIKGELKWQKMSPAYYDLYKDVIDYFFSSHIRFRAIVIETDKVNHIKFNNNDSELGFYKFYYQLLHHWILDFNQYDVFVDLKTNRIKGRLNELQKVLQNANLSSRINQVQGLPSQESLGIQLADFLTGLTLAKFNSELTSKAKLSLIKYVEETYIGNSIRPTPKWKEKFNVFQIDLKGGW